MSKLLFVIATAGLASAASAAQLRIENLGAGSNHNVPGFNSTRGGIFNVRVIDTTGLTTVGGDLHAMAEGEFFQTFCVEISETVNVPGNYNFQVNTGSILGGNSPFNPQPLASGTAYLYSQFRAGTLAGYNGTNGSVNALQDAIWYFQNQLGDGSTPDDVEGLFAQLSGAAQAFVTLAETAIANSLWHGTGNVRILNLDDVNDGSPEWDRQDILVLIPLPHGAGLASVGLLALGARRRRLA